MVNDSELNQKLDRCNNGKMMINTTAAIIMVVATTKYSNGDSDTAVVLSHLILAASKI